MIELKYEYIYIIVFFCSFFIICLASGFIFGDPIYNKIKNCCKSNKVEDKYTTLIVQEL